MGGSDSSSSSTSYGYLPYISPGDAQIIGNYQQNAANNAAAIAQQQLGAAMAQVQQNFNSANTALAPYSQTGVEAQDQLNQYLGLSPYNPGTAPTAPTAYAPTPTDIQNYISQNISEMGSGDNNIYAMYNGVGSSYDGWSNWDEDGSRPTGQDVVGALGVVNPAVQNAALPAGLATNQNAIVQNLYNNQTVNQAVTQQLTQQYNDNNAATIAAQNQTYQQDLANYNQNEALYNQYTAAGPLTAQQIDDNITNQPGYQAQQDAGITAIQKAASANGLLGSGNMLQDISTFASQLQGEYYNNTLNRLSGLAQQGAGAAAGTAQNDTTNGNTLANLYSTLGDTLSNAQLAGGQAASSAYQLGSQQYQQVLTGQSQSQSSSSGGLSGIGSLVGAFAKL